MKIKRFEATSMSEALRQIKKEFGDEAVILSAKTHKKGKRFLGKHAAQKVVVTAAVDQKPEVTQSKNQLFGNRDQPSEKRTGAYGAKDSGDSASGILTRFNPITKTGRMLLKPIIAERMTETMQQKNIDDDVQVLKDAGLDQKLAVQWDEQIRGLLPEEGIGPQDIRQALSQVIQAQKIVGTLYRGKRSKQKQVVVIGPAGVGKTCAVAKMAARQALQNPDTVAMMSFDNQRVAGVTELERLSKIMRVSFKTAFTIDALKEAIVELDEYPLVLVDTPGISPDSRTQREELRRLLAFFDNAETILLLNAALQEHAMDQMIQFFKAFNIHSLLFTGLDWAMNVGTMINVSERHKLPIGYLSHSPKIPDGLKVSTADLLAMLLFPKDRPDEEEDRQPVTLLHADRSESSPHYVANRNSDIFHLHTCKSVKRINADNMIVFKDPVEAMGQQFKPCRVCSSAFIAPKPKDRPARGYAGSRYECQ
jgi:flagellar biosynthesis protein FlhF